jgi:hypothetical protein
MIFGFSYATSSVFDSDRERAMLGLSVNAKRPVRFHARVTREIFTLRTALRALGEAIWSRDTWMSREDYLSNVLDPIITVHPDRVMFEAFTGDQGAYVALHVDRDLFETEGEVVTGTTNIDFSAWLWSALADMRSSRETWLRVGAEGFEVRTVSGGGRFEKKVDVPDAWVRGFLQTQGAMSLSGTQLTVRPVDVLSAIRWLRYTKAKVSPRGMRYIFEPNQDAALVLEPWEHRIPLKGAEHHYTEPRTIRVWGRRRLKLIEPLLPFAEKVDVYLKGRSMPSFYAVKLPGMTFVLGIGGAAEGFRDTASFELLGSTRKVEAADVDKVMAVLVKKIAVTPKYIAEACSMSLETAQAVLEKLCRLGRAMFDVQERQFRHRELFEKPLDEARLYPPDARLEKAEAMLASGSVSVTNCAAEETRKVKTLKTLEGKIEREVVFRDWRVIGSAGDQKEVELVVNDNGRLIFGRCGCAFFKQHLLSRGPCEHLLALFRHSDAVRQDLPSSTATPSSPKEADIDDEDDDD